MSATPKSTSYTFADKVHSIDLFGACELEFLSLSWHSDVVEGPKTWFISDCRWYDHTSGYSEFDIGDKGGFCRDRRRCMVAFCWMP